MQSLKLGLLGQRGRMGQAILGIISEYALFEPLAPLSTKNREERNRDLIARADIVIDFTSPEGANHHLSCAQEFKKPFLLGTTGLLKEHHTQADQLARSCPVLIAPNTSIGHTVLEQAVMQIASRLDTSFDIDILDIHHNQKKDAPSGSARALGLAAARGRGWTSQALEEPHTLGKRGTRTPDSIGMASIRGGSVTGEHQVMFLGRSESLTLTHRVADRSVFAHGALRAATWLCQKPPGLYQMSDVT